MAQDAQLISQAGLVESLASDGLVSVSTGAGQPQKNMELAKFADSLGSSVPLQQSNEQVSITGLYARTSDGKMVELTKESVASVMAGLMRTTKMVQNVTLDGGVIYKIGDNSYEWERKQMVCFLRSSLGGDSSEVVVSYMKNNVYVSYSGASPAVVGFKFGYSVDGNTVSVFIKSTHASDTSVSATFIGMDLIARTTLSSWDTDLTPKQNVFGYNTLAELSSGVAEQMGYIGKKSYALESGQEVSTGFTGAGAYVIFNASAGRSSLVVSGAIVLDAAAILYNDADISHSLSASNKVCFNRKSTNGEFFLKNNYTSSLNLIIIPL